MCFNTSFTKNAKECMQVGTDNAKIGKFVKYKNLLVVHYTPLTSLPLPLSPRLLSFLDTMHIPQYVMSNLLQQAVHNPKSFVSETQFSICHP